MSKFGKRETVEPASKGVVETMKSAASSVAAKVTGGGADFFTSGVANSKRKGKTWKVEHAGVQTDANGRQYTVNSVGDRQYSDGVLPSSTASPVKPAFIEQNTNRPFGIGSRGVTAWTAGTFSTHIPRDAYLNQPRMSAVDHERRRGLAYKAQEWFENILSIGTGRSK
jgi:hypothetical protein